MLRSEKPRPSASYNTQTMKRTAALFLLLALPAAAQELTLDQWCRKHEIRLVTDPKDLYPLRTSHGFITGAPAPERTLNAYRELLVAELLKYPRAFVRKIGLERIVLADALAFDGQKRAAVPDFEHRTLHLDPREGSYSKLYQQTVIHHEIFHIVDWRDDGELYEDREWRKLNPDGFKYGDGGRNARGNDQWQLDDSLVGFLNKYSMSGVEEDKAEIYSNLLVRPATVRARAQGDRFLARKVERMKELLRAFCPELDSAFWKSLDR